MTSDRKHQLREAKRRQRKREADAGLGVYQLRLPTPLLQRLKMGMRRPDFVEALAGFLESEVLYVPEHPGLKSICWNLRDQYLTRREAFALYERNWRYLEGTELDKEEAHLIDELRKEYGRGVINA